MEPLHRTGVLVRRPVAVGDVRIGVAVEALFDRGLARLVGLDVGCREGARRFLPFPACEVEEDRLAVASALVLLDRELGFYRVGSRAFSDLLGEEVSLGWACSSTERATSGASSSPCRPATSTSSRARRSRSGTTFFARPSEPTI